MLQDLQWDTLETMRRHARFCIMYKMCRGLLDGDWEDYLITNTESRTRGSKGDEVVVSQLFSAACPVRVELLKRYLAMFKIPPGSKDLIFKPISRGKECCKLVAPDKPISYSTIRGAFRRDPLSLGVEPSKFGLHSLRSGGATMAANNGVNDRISSDMAVGNRCKPKTPM